MPKRDKIKKTKKIKVSIREKWADCPICLKTVRSPTMRTIHRGRPLALRVCRVCYRGLRRSIAQAAYAAASSGAIEDAVAMLDTIGVTFPGMAVPRLDSLPCPNEAVVEVHTVKTVDAPCVETAEAPKQLDLTSPADPSQSTPTA